MVKFPRLSVHMLVADGREHTVASALDCGIEWSEARGLPVLTWPYSSSVALGKR